MGNTSWSGTRTAFPTPMRRQILARDPICRTCGQRPSTVADHVIPWAEGGTHTLANGQGLCDPCHWKKTRAEQDRGRARKSRKRPPPRHPGLL
jgi:5-methylcytosine-specific restriction protein A